MGTQSDLQALRELIKVTFAQRDFKTARAIANVLLQWEAAKPGAHMHDPLWNALIVSYARPFMSSRKMGTGLAGKRWTRFDDERLESVHRTLTSSRNRDVAHTEDVKIGQVAYVLPPGAFGSVGSTTTGKIPWAHEATLDATALLDRQIDVAEKRIRELVDRLFGWREWTQGTMLRLDWPDTEEDVAAILTGQAK